jgi:hypothetical protein
MAQSILFVDIFASDLVYAFPYFWNLLGKSTRLIISHNADNVAFLKCQLIIHERTDHLVQIEKSIASCGYADVYGMTNGNDCWRLTPQSSISIKSAPLTPISVAPPPATAPPTPVATAPSTPVETAPPTLASTLAPSGGAGHTGPTAFGTPTFAPPTFRPPTFAPPIFGTPTFTWSTPSRVAEVKPDKEKEKEKAKEPQIWKPGEPWIRHEEEEDRGASLYW